MVEITVYKTTEDAKRVLGKYEQDNREAQERREEVEGYARSGKIVTERLGKQTYFLVAELGAYVDDDYPGKFYFESTAYPFLGWDSLKDDICSLVKELKVAVRRQTPKNIEVILYTVEDHNTNNQEFKKKAEEFRKLAEGYWLPGRNNEDVSVEMSEEEFYKECKELENTKERGLTYQERQEFVRLYLEE